MYVATVQDRETRQGKKGLAEGKPGKSPHEVGVCPKVENKSKKTAMWP